MVSNPFRSTKWRHISTTTELRPIASPQMKVIAPPSPPDSTTTTKKKKNIPFNSDTLLDGIGDYIFQSPLGGGKFSKVMLCYHYLTGLKVAIKVNVVCFDNYTLFLFEPLLW